MPKIYDVNEVNLIIEGKYVTDFAEGTSIVVTWNADSMIKTIGIKGETAYAANNDKSGTITFSLQHTSPSNDWLDEYAANRKFISVAMIDDNIYGGIRLQNNQCVIMRPADVTRGLEVSAREWTIDMSEINV